MDNLAGEPYTDTQDEDSMFLPQPEAQHQQAVADLVDDSDQVDRQQEDDAPDSPESSDLDEDGQSAINDLINAIEQERKQEQEASDDEDGMDEEEEPSKSHGRGKPSSPDCRSCKTLKARVERLERRLAGKRKAMTSKNDRLGRLIKSYRELKKLLQEKNEEIRNLKAILSHYRIRNGKVRRGPNPNVTPRQTSAPWKRELRSFYDNPSSGNGRNEAWQLVWRAQYQQSNIPLSLTLLHPDIRLEKPEGDDDNEDESITFGDSSVAHFDTSMSMSSPRDGSCLFDKLPQTILLKILTETLFFSGRVIHIFSRLDPYGPPRSYRAADPIPGRIYISDGVRAYVSLTRDTISPRKLLSPLCVNRQWHFFGAHVFYGNNTFAFSSFGEFGRFCKGIGEARLQRIAHLELHWQGGSCVRFAETDTDRHWSKTKDFRSMPLAYLTEMKRLDTLVVHIDESQVRRRWEDNAVMHFAAAATEGQPNHRMTRALRACRGWDYLHMLRNLSWIRIYDTAKMNATCQRKSSVVRDLSAVLDLNRTCRMKNTPSRAVNCRLTRLLPLHPRVAGKWQPQIDDFKYALRAMDLPSGLHINDLDEVVSSSSDDDDGGDGDDRNDSANEDGSSENEGSEHDEVDDGEGDEKVRRDRTEQFVRSQGGECDFDFDYNNAFPRSKSEGGFVSHLSDPLQRPDVIVIESESDDEIEIIPRSKLPQTQDRFTSAARCSTTSGLFVTPNPEERQTVFTAIATASPSPGPGPKPTLPNVIDLTTLESEAIIRDPKTSQGTKRSGSYDEDYSEKKKIKADYC